MARRAQKSSDKAPRSTRRSASPAPTNSRRKRAKRAAGPPLGARIRLGWERFKARTTPLHRPLLLLIKTCVVFAAAAGAIAVGRLVEQHVRSTEAFATVEILWIGMLALAGFGHLLRLLAAYMSVSAAD